MSIEIQVDTSNVDRELRRLEHAPDAGAIMRLEGVFTRVFQETQRVVHVQTGSLKNSGDMFSVEHHHEWEGEIKYGGSSPGAFFDPVDYAQAERARGGAHDFMRPIVAADQGYIDAILAMFRDDT